MDEIKKQNNQEMVNENTHYSGVDPDINGSYIGDGDHFADELFEFFEQDTSKHENKARGAEMKERIVR